MDRMKSLFFGLAAAILVTSLYFTGRPLAAGLALLYLPLVTILRPAASERNARVGVALLGAAGGVALATWLLDHGIQWSWLVGGASLVACVVLPHGRRRGFPEAGPAWALLLSGGALAVCLAGCVSSALNATGADAAGYCFALVPLLVTAAGGAGAAAFLLERHHRLRAYLPAALGLAAAVCIGLESLTANQILDLARNDQGPSVNRTHFLFGVALLALSIGGYAAALLGALVAAAASRATGSLRLLLLATGGWVALVFARPGWPAVVAMCLAAGAALLLVPGLRPRLLFAAAAILVLLVVPHRFADWGKPFLRDDPIVLADGRAARPQAGFPGDRGRLRWEPPPGWPVPGQPRSALLAVIAAVDQSGAPPVVLPPELFADPLPDLPGRMRELGDRLANGPAALALSVDLAELNPADLALAARLASDHVADPVTLLHGTICTFLGFPDPADRARLLDQTRDSWPRPALSAAATAALAQEAGAANGGRIMLRSSRVRLSGRQPALAARNLRDLLRRADLLDPAGAVPPWRMEARIRLELAAAILADDAGEEDRLYALLERIDAPDATDLWTERCAARERLVEQLFAARDEDPADADVRHRLGRALVHSGRVPAGLEELTYTIYLRPKLLADAVDLAEAYLLAEATGYRRWTPTGPLDNLNMIQIARNLPYYACQLTDESLSGRWRLAVGRSWIARAHRPQTPPADRFRALHVAIREFAEALKLDPRLPTAERWLAVAKRNLGRPLPALDHARRAVRNDPLDPASHAILALLTSDPEERCRAVEAFVMLSPGLAPPRLP